jgi:hypothetical protein
VLGADAKTVVIECLGLQAHLEDEVAWLVVSLVNYALMKVKYADYCRKSKTKITV